METEKILFKVARSIGCMPSEARRRAVAATRALLTPAQYRKEIYKAGYEKGFEVGQHVSR